MKSKVSLGLRVKECSGYFQMYRVEQDGRILGKPFKSTGSDIIEAYRKNVLPISVYNLLTFLGEPKDLLFSAFKLKRYK